MELMVSKSEFAKFWGISRGRVSQLLRLGILKEADDGRLRARESIESLVLYRHRPRHKPSKDSPMADLEIDLTEALKSLVRKEKER